MDLHRFKKEVAALSQRYHVVATNEFQGIELRDFNYPTGWKLQNRRQWQRLEGVPDGPNHIAPLMVRLPAAWPWAQPYIYVPQDLRYSHAKVEHLIDDRKAPDGWYLWCVHDLGLHPSDPDSRLPNLLRMMQASFSFPDKDEPLRYVYGQQR